MSKGKEKMLKVIATVHEVYVEPDFEAQYKCPHCGANDHQEIYSDNCTETVQCYSCKNKYKVKIPKDSMG